MSSSSRVHVIRWLCQRVRQREGSSCEKLSVCVHKVRTKLFDATLAESFSGAFFGCSSLSADLQLFPWDVPRPLFDVIGDPRQQNFTIGAVLGGPWSGRRHDLLSLQLKRPTIQVNAPSDDKLRAADIRKWMAIVTKAPTCTVLSMLSEEEDKDR